MEESLENIEYFEKYFEGKMTSEEKAAFEAKLSVNSDLEEDWQTFNTAINGLELHEVKKKLKLIHEQQQYKGKQVFFTPRKLLVAASFSILAVCLSWLFLIQFSEKDIYQSYFEPYPSIYVLRDRSSSPFQNAMEYYSKEEYTTVISYLEKITPSDENYNKARFYLGVSLLAAGQTTKSIEVLNWVQNTDTAYAQLAKWYLGLAYIKEDNVALAQKAFSSIEPGDYNYKEAAQILEELKQIK